VHDETMEKQGRIGKREAASVAQAFQPAGLATFQSPEAELESSATSRQECLLYKMFLSANPIAILIFGISNHFPGLQICRQIIDAS